MGTINGPSAPYPVCLIFFLLLNFYIERVMYMMHIKTDEHTNLEIIEALKLFDVECLL